VVFEKIAQTCAPEDEVLVVQTAITEKGREDLVDFDVTDFPYKYPFKLLNTIPLEKVSQVKTTFDWIKIIRQFKPDVINLTGYNEFGTLPVLLLAKLLGVKTIITIESVAHQGGRFQMIKRIYKKIVYNLIDGVFSYGLNTNRFLFDQGVPKSKILSFLNSFDQRNFQLDKKNKTQEKPYLLYVGRLSSEKNIGSLVELMKGLKDQLLIIGDGPERPNLEKISGPNIQFLGSIAWAKLPNYFAGASCLLLPSFYEPWGMVANEAQAMGIPVICTDASGCANDLIIEGFNGLVVQDFILEKDRIIEFLNQIPGKKYRFEEFAQRNSLVFSVDRLSKEMIDGMHRLLKLQKAR
jgi:glycosyltransferase involved in cell wall biosynthesis